ncbi:FxLYD domain-containing protein [Halorubrum sp. DTA98]|uniref:FxLYD domain-containing protein n=1 Tax=Halorubrum sp. DTA98 TaxID=3402163 RepID=UPI003AAFDF0C
MRRRRLLSTAGTIASTALAGCSAPVLGPDDEDDTRDDDGPPARVVESELVREHVGTDEETVAVEGIVERTRDEAITYLEVRVEFYGDDEEVLDTTVEHLDDVTEGDRWPFTVVFSGVGEAAARVTDYDVEVVRNP